MCNLETASEPRTVWNILGSCRKTPCVRPSILGLETKMYMKGNSGAEQSNAPKHV